MSAYRRTFRGGSLCGGWRCSTCGALFQHNNKRRRTFARLTVHTLVRHHRLPRAAVLRLRFTALGVTEVRP